MVSGFTAGDKAVREGSGCAELVGAGRVIGASARGVPRVMSALRSDAPTSRAVSEPRPKRASSNFGTAE